MLHVTRWATGTSPYTIQLLVCGTKGALTHQISTRVRTSSKSRPDKRPQPWKMETTPMFRKTPSIAARFIKSIRTGINDQPDFQRGAEIQKVLDACFCLRCQGKNALVCRRLITLEILAQFACRVGVLVESKLAIARGGNLRGKKGLGLEKSVL